MTTVLTLSGGDGSTLQDDTDIDSYIAKYRPEWQRLEQACAGGAAGLTRRSGPEIEETVRLYLRASSHLSEVSSRYGDPALVDYLNALVARAHGALYGSLPRTVRGFLAVFGSRYRSAIRRTLPYIVVSGVLLVVVVVATALWVGSSREAEAGLLPPAAREAIRRSGGGRADLGVDPASLSTLILLNNVRVALLAFALGITVGVGTLFVVATNGFLIGALAGAYHAAGRGGEFWSLVLPHGVLEIIAICIAAGAGLRLGWSIVDPGDRPRLRALAEDAADAVVVVVGVVPAFLIAAFIEGFVTDRLAPGAVEVAIGGVVGALYLAFLLGPRRRSEPAVGLDAQVPVDQLPGQPPGGPVHHVDAQLA